MSSWSFVAIQEYGKAQRDGAELGGHRLLYQPGARGRRAPAIMLYGDEAKTFVGVECSKYAVVAELRQYAAVCLHLSHFRKQRHRLHPGVPGGFSNDCGGTTVEPLFFGMDSNVGFAWSCESVIGEFSLCLTPNERVMPLLEHW